MANTRVLRIAGRSAMASLSLWRVDPPVEGENTYSSRPVFSKSCCPQKIFRNAVARAGCSGCENAGGCKQKARAATSPIVYLIGCFSEEFRAQRATDGGRLRGLFRREVPRLRDPEHKI